MARINVEERAFTDSRFARLAHLLGLADRDHARSKVEWLWLECTNRGEPELPQWVVEQHLGERGAQALVDSELASWGRGRGDSKTRRIYIRGARDLTGWLARKKDQSSKGGKARASVTSRDGGRFTSQSETPPPAAAKIPTSAPAPAPAPAPAEEERAPRSAPLRLESESDKPKRESKPAVVFQPAVDAFDGYYRRTHGDSKPTWDGKTIGMLKQLCSKHDCAEVVRRVRSLESNPPKWPPAPWDLATFVANFDKCAPSTSAEPIRSIPRL